MAVKGVDELVSQVKDYLEANVNDTVTTINALFSDGITLGDVLSWRYDDPGRPLAVGELPSIHVVAEGLQVAQWGAAYDHSEAMLSVHLTDSDPDSEAVRRRLYRWDLVLRETLKAGHFDSTISWQMGMGMVDPAPPITTDFSATFTRNNHFYSALSLLSQFSQLEQ